MLRPTPLGRPAMAHWRIDLGDRSLIYQTVQWNQSVVVISVKYSETPSSPSIVGTSRRSARTPSVRQFSSPGSGFENRCAVRVIPISITRALRSHNRRHRRQQHHQQQSAVAPLPSSVVRPACHAHNNTSHAARSANHSETIKTLTRRPRRYLCDRHRKVSRRILRLC
jgi:hypothetical protein